jgi:transposase
MPYITDKVIIKDPFLDKRVKLLPCQKEMVLYYRAQGWSQRELARHFNVSRRLITLVTDPEKQKRNLERRMERGGHSQYYSTEKNNAYMRKHRQDKYKTLKDTVKNKK